MKTLKQIFFAFTLILLSFNVAFAQCYHPTGWFASEVLLNKPNVTYDLSLLEATGNVTVERGSILYRSHYDERVAVVLTPFELFSEKGLDMRLQLPTKVVSNTIKYIELELNETVRVIDLELMGGRNTGWILDLDYRPDPMGGPPIQVANLTKDNLKVTFIPNMNETFPDTYVRVELSNVTNINDQDISEFSMIFDAIGYPKTFNSLIQGYEFKELPLTTHDLASALEIESDKFGWTEAVRVELEWLQRNRVISGLNEGDIETLSTLAPFAWGEHNFKSRYYKDGWVLGINEEMLQEEYTYEYQGPANCNGFDPSVLPDVTVDDFNAGSQPLEIVFGQSFTAAAVRGLIILAVIIAILVVYFKKIRS